MELRHLRYFVAVSEALHFGQAAATLGIAQPSLSHQIRQLETELQTTLLRRTKRRVELTEAGRLFLEQARDILARADRAAVIARRSSQGETGRLRVGVGCCMNQLEVGKVVSLFNQRHPSIRVELSTMAVPAQFDALQHARLDIGLVRPPIPEAALTGEILTNEPLMMALRNDHRCHGRRSVALSAFADAPFVLPARPAVRATGGVRAERSLRSRSAADGARHGDCRRRRRARTCIRTHVEGAPRHTHSAARSSPQRRDGRGMAKRGNVGAGRRVRQDCPARFRACGSATKLREQQGPLTI